MSDPQYPYPGGSQPPQQPPYPPQGYPSYPPGGAPPGGYPGGPSGGHPPGPPRRQGGTTWLVVAIVVLGLVAVGTVTYALAGDDEPDVRTDLTLADLEPALLAADQVPEGYEPTEWEERREDDLGADEVDGPRECREALARLALMDAVGEETGVSYEREDNAANITHTLSVADAEDVSLDELEGAINACHEFSYEEDGGSSTMRMSAEPIDGIGDDALLLSVGVQTESDGYLIDIELGGVMFEREGVQSSVLFTGGFDEFDTSGGGRIDGDPVDQAALRAAAEAADRNLDGVV